MVDDVRSKSRDGLEFAKFITREDGHVAVAVDLTGADSGTGSAGSSGLMIYSTVAGDFTATTVQGTNTFTIAGLPFTLTAEMICNGGVKKIDSSGNVTDLPVTNVTVSGSTVTLGDWESTFASGDTVSVSLVAQRITYTSATDSSRDEEIDPLDEHYLEEELVDDTNLDAATVYYPSSTGQAMGNFNNVSIHGVTSGGVTVTIEAKIDDSTDWVDITPAGYRLDDNTTGNASFVDQTFMLDFDDLHVRNIRIKSVTADATNGVQYHWKLTAI
jgi:hypothetical protein